MKFVLLNDRDDILFFLIFSNIIIVHFCEYSEKCLDHLSQTVFSGIVVSLMGRHILSCPYITQ